MLYWQIGRDILNRQQQQSWEAKVINHLAADLQKAFPRNAFHVLILCT
ncbi:MAG: DUF1016 N-terminal domain-containing protein [Nostoc sp. ChiVER01]|nr:MULTISPECIES: DUF1016 N-terminal domain-containing protein [unclassified Nostoc]MDZ8127089.1 DUF1016 N-terminal domain-containing protein [Nostoc sp. CmiVER01]MDZ8222374.1 DUF1016 N-terminal domain-containing protein [Nostoc sp. ChiVER01]